MEQSPNLRKLAARSLNRSCKQFLGDSSQCDLMATKFEQGEISFDDYVKEMEGVFQHHTPIEQERPLESVTPAEPPKESAENILKKLLEK
ncbi:MAG: hypothetical protein M0R06_14185 [Sphaerochaeta sp.]|nr:hypothetical protein [Sphaerochaeta sp.]MDD2730589.1 hypothetical protein [Candidatus Portnoybacteria bacterium]